MAALDRVEAVGKAGTVLMAGGLISGNSWISVPRRVGAIHPAGAT